jgi:hypothetical protein
MFYFYPFKIDYFYSWRSKTPMMMLLSLGFSAIVGVPAVAGVHFVTSLLLLVASLFLLASLSLLASLLLQGIDSTSLCSQSQHF